jgi:hypothetical protein
MHGHCKHLGKDNFCSGVLQHQGTGTNCDGYDSLLYVLYKMTCYMTEVLLAHVMFSKLHVLLPI